MNVLAGSLYGSAAAVPMIALLSTAGSSGSYWLSRLVVKVRCYIHQQDSASLAADTQP